MTTTVTNPTPPANGKARAERKSLAQEIDRLDRMLEGLSDSLNESVAAAVQDAVRGAVTLAVQAAVQEVLASPAFLDRIRAAAAPAQPAPARPAPAGPGLFARMATTLKGWAVQGWAWAKATVADVSAAAKACWAEMKSRAASAWARAKVLAWLLWGLLCLLRRPLLVAAGVGLAVAVGCYLAGPLVGALVSGTGGVLTTLAALVLVPWRPVVAVMRGGTLTRAAD
jgi:hypothetical protein